MFVCECVGVRECVCVCVCGCVCERERECESRLVPCQREVVCPRSSSPIRKRPTPWEPPRNLDVGLR